MSQALGYLDPQEALKEIHSEEEDPLLNVSYWFGQFHILVEQLSGVKCLPEVYQYAVSSHSSWKDVFGLAFAGGAEVLKTWQPLTVGIPIEVAKRLYKIYDRNRKQLSGH